MSVCVCVRVCARARGRGLASLKAAAVEVYQAVVEGPAGGQARHWSNRRPSPSLVKPTAEPVTGQTGPPTGG